MVSKRPDHQSPPPIRSHRIVCGNCITEAPKHLPDGSVDLLICDPPFGIGEGRFGQQYNRNSKHVLPGYAEAPADYAKFTLNWMTQARRVLKRDGSVYVVSGFTNLRHVLSAAAELDLHLVNEIIWQYPFGVYTRKKYVGCHYHILYFTRSPKAKPTFNRACRFADDARDENGRSLQYRDREDVWAIKREYHRGKSKNANKLPDALVEKIVAYSSNPGEIVGDFFLGNFTTASVAGRMARIAVGFELNPRAYKYHVRRLGL